MKSTQSISLFFVIFIILFLITSTDFKREGGLSAEEAKEIALSTEAYQSFETYIHWLLKEKGVDKEDCIESRVVRPCDSEWVGCVDEAWVFEADFLKSCVNHDERLHLFVVVDSESGEIISNYPEPGYYRSRHYCVEDYECSCISGLEGSCANFIAYSTKLIKDNLEEGQCQENRCLSK